MNINVWGAGRVAPSRAIGKSQAALLLVIVLLASVLAACGEEATPVPPTATPTPRFQQENNQELLFSMNVPYGWTKNSLDSTSVVYTDPKDPNRGIGIVSRSVDNLGPDAKNLQVERSDSLKKRFPGAREDVNGGGSLVLTDNTVGINRLSYTNNNNLDVIQYVTQVNNVKAGRAYVLFSVTTAKDADTYRPLYLEAFKSFSSTAKDVVSSVNQANLADPTVVAANAGGKIRPAGAQESKGRVLRLVAWESPVVSSINKQPRITGNFPFDYGWRISRFPTQEQPALYLESPIVDRTTRQVVMQFGVYKDALPQSSPSAEDWKKFYSPILTTLTEQKLKSYGPVVKLGDVATVGATYRVPFSAIDALGEVQSRGIILFSKSGSHGLVSVMSLSPQASTNQTLLESLDVDFQTIVNSFNIKY